MFCRPQSFFGSASIEGESAAAPTPPAAQIAPAVPAPKASTSQAPSSAHSAETSDYRVAVFGAGGVGKSSIVQRFVNGTFSDNYVPTIEDTYRQVISCNQKNVCTLQITDTTGSHQFPAMQRLSMSKGHAFILIYSVTSRQSLEELGPIVKMLMEVKGSSIAEVPIMLVGNKKDESSVRYYLSIKNA
ncbi:unnamed protein product, partial [Mesorhabditis belari]|uniref:GTP-binding protein Di-Ras2 n=1 Tax=Mesorhabditis belari TaxID=2138241 RepID=A0AAF3F4C2_9BILA